MSFASASLVTQFHDYFQLVNACFKFCLNRFLNVKAFNQEKAQLIGAFSVIVKIQTCEGSFPALVVGWWLNAMLGGGEGDC